MKIVCIGSSSVEGIGDRLGIGWVGRLNNYLQQNSQISENRVFNLGLKGDTLQGTIERYKTEALKRNPHLVVIFTGSNDCATHIKDSTVIQKPNLDEYTASWNKFLQQLGQASHKTLILGPSMVNEGSIDFKGVNISFKNTDLADYNRQLKFLCKQYNIEFLELFNLFKADIANYSFDFVHPNSNGYDLISQTLIKKLEELNYVK